MRYAGFYYIRIADEQSKNLNWTRKGMFIDMETGKFIYAAYLAGAEYLYFTGQMAMSRFYDNFQHI